MNITTLGNFQMLSKIKTPAELSAERYAYHTAEVNQILHHIRSEFRGVPCTIPLSWHDGMSGSCIIARPTEEVWKIVQEKLEKELKSAGWEPSYVYLVTSGILWWKTTKVFIIDHHY